MSIRTFSSSTGVLVVALPILLTAQTTQRDTSAPPAYAFSSPVGFRCGADRREVPDTSVSVIDILLDSLPADTIGTLGFNVHFASKEGQAGISVSMDYTSAGRRAGTACKWAAGVTLIVNVRRAVSPTLNAVATGPVQVTIRDVHGLMLGGPIRLSPGKVPDSLSWRRRPNQPNPTLQPDSRAIVGAPRAPLFDAAAAERKH